MQTDKQFQFTKLTDTGITDPLKVEWRESLTAPQDDMWEAFTDNANHWELKEGNQTIGYACVNDDNILLQFYLVPQWMHVSVDIFQEFISQQKISKAMVGSNNSFFFSIAMHFQKSIEIDTYLFTDFLKVKTIEKEGLRSAESEDLEKLIHFYNESMGGPEEWLRSYIGNLINRGEIFLLVEEKEILGTCEVRKSETNPDVAAVGMVVSPTHRRKGLGTYLLGKAKEIARRWNKQPVCSCEKDNIGSLKSIQSNGFRSLHQMLLMKF